MLLQLLHFVHFDVDAICNQMPALGDVCAEESTRWYYSSDRKTCVKFAYKGCNGNSNNFNTSRECLSFCQSTGTFAHYVKFL